MNAHQVETIVAAAVLLLLGLLIWRLRGKRSISFDDHVNEYGVRVLTANDSLSLYESKLPKDESHIRRQAIGVQVQKRMAQYIRERPIPRRRSLVVIPQKAEPNNVVHLPTGQPVQVTVRRPKLTMVR